MEFLAKTYILYVVVIKSSSHDHTPYWYSEMIGRQFECYFEKYCGIHIGNNMPKDCYHVYDNNTYGDGGYISNVIHPDDVEIISQTELTEKRRTVNNLK